MAEHSGQTVPSIVNEEHQHNLAAKRVVQLDNAGNVINGSGLTPSVDYDYVSLSQASTTDTWTFKAGGSGGTTVQTIVITYTDSTKATISNVSWS